jgi:hypothetical protein
MTSISALRVQITIAPLHRHAHGCLLGLGQHGLVFRRGDVLAGGFVVLEGFDAEWSFGFPGGHFQFRLEVAIQGCEISGSPARMRNSGMFM